MKNLVFSMLAMAAMVSCTSESDPISDITDGDKVEIKLNAGFSVKTKAPVTSNADGVLDDALTDIQFIQAPDAATAVWTGVNTVASTADIKAEDKATGAISFNTTLYYNANTNLKSWLIGYYPAADANFLETNAGKLQWTIDGSKDILLSNECNGNKESKMSDITFDHQLIQLQFKFVAEDTKAADTWGTIQSIAVKRKNASTLEDLNSVLTCTLPNTLSWGTPAKLTVRKANDTDGFLDTELSNLNLTTTESLGGYIMVEPIDTDYYLEITTSKGKAETKITLGGSGTAEKGKAYEVTLTFKATSIAPTAKITTWTTVSGGSGTVE